MGSFTPLHATHIAGAELTYECINPATHTYRLRLIMYRDCLNANPGAVFDSPIDLFIFPTGQSTAPTIIQLTNPSVVQLTLPNLGACVASPPNICIERGEYTAIINLPPLPFGYDVGWQRCCRNNIILNLVSPLQRGMTWTTHIPGTFEVSVPNNGSSFRNVLPYFLCVGEELVFDHSAIDLDGDSLAYKLVAAYDGINFLGLGAGNGVGGANTPVVTGGVGGNPMGRPPYLACNYNPGFSAQQPFGTANGGFTTLNSQTGQLRIRPGNPGTYVLTVEVEEYRSGILIARNRRDIQLTVVVCLNFGSPPTISRNFLGARFNGSNFFFSPDSGQCFRFQISDPDANRQMQARVNYTVVGGTSPFPTFTSTGTNPVNVTVCWTPTCNQSATRLRLDLVAEDVNGCSNYNSEYDTVFLNVAPVLQTRPVVQFSAPGRTIVRDTILNIEPDTLVCFEYLARDLNQLGRPTHQLIQTQNLGIAPTTTILAQTDSSVRVRVCWRPNCTALNGTATFVASSTRQECPPAPITFDTIHVRVGLPADAPPTLQLDPNLGTRVNGVLQVNLDQNFCLPFVLRDANPRLNAGLSTYQASISIVGGGNYSGSNPAINIISRTDTAVRGTVCLPSQCVIANTRLRLRLTGNQPNKCRPNHVVRDSVDFIIRVPPNPRPRLSQVLPAGLNIQGDTVFLAPNGLLCYEVQYRDSLPVGSRAFRVSAFRQGGGSVPLPGFGVLSQTDTLSRLRLCYNGSCALRGAPIGLVLEADDSVQCVLMHRVRDTLWLAIRDQPNPRPTLRFGFPTPPTVTQADTIVLAVDSTFCFNTLGEDLLAPSFTLRTRFLRVINAQGQPQAVTLPPGTRIGTTPTLITDRWCFTPRCSLLNQTLGFVYELTDSSLCQVDHRVPETLWVRIRQLPNPPPTLTFVFPQPPPTVADTLLLTVDSTFCFNSVAEDLGTPRFTIRSRFLRYVDALGQPLTLGAPTTTRLTTTPTTLTDRWCFTPRCSLLNQKIGLVFEVTDSNSCTVDHRIRDTVWVRIRQLPNPPPTLTFVFPQPPPTVADTLLLTVDSTFCFNSVAEDLGTPRFTLRSRFLRYVDALGQPITLAAPATTRLATLPTRITDRWCWVPRCAQLNQKIGLVFEVTDSNSCTVDHRIRDTVWVRIRQLPNTPPTLNILTLPGVLNVNDTLLIVADSTVCYRTVGRDTGLLAFSLSKRYAGAITPDGQPWVTNIPTPTPVQITDSLLLTDWCWRAPCDQIGRTVGLVYELADSNTCTLDYLRRDTLWLRIIRPRLNPPTFTWTTSLPRVGDTVLYDVNQPGSLQLTLEDLAQQGALQLSVDGAPVPLTDSVATGILNTTWTWRPLCENLDTTIRLVFTGSSSPPCADTTLFVTDTVYLRVVEPVNNAPSIARDIGFDNTRTPGDTLCYTLTVTDPDVNPLLVVQGVSASFNSAFGAGSPARFTLQDTNPLLVRVCIVPNCYQQEESFFVTLCVTDTSTCTQRFVVCDSIRLTVGICHLRMPNVFTPNGDGVNETFGPYDDQGIEEYTLSVFDRWGRQLYGPTVNGRWNGTWNNAAAPDGTYFYRIRYRLFSGQASPLGSDQTGQVTILR